MAILIYSEWRMKFKVFSSHGNRVSHKRYDVENVSQGWIVWTSDSIPWESSSSGRATRHQWFWNRKMFAHWSEQYRKDVINGSEKEFSDEREARTAPLLAGSPDTLNLLSHTIHFHSSPLQLWHSYRWACDSRDSWHFIFVNFTGHSLFIYFSYF